MLIILLSCTLPSISLGMGAGVDIYCFSVLSMGESADSSISMTPENILELLYSGRSDAALEVAERYLEAEPLNPLPYLIKARVLRERLPEQDDNKDLIREDSAPIHNLLDRAIEICEDWKKTSEGDIKLYFYRGWAWMFKAQLHALGGSYWSAGRAAARGNGDLKKYLSSYPDDPDAKGIMGTFLYFADTLPAVVKVIKKLFLIPGGDRERGLEYLNYAAGQKSLLRTDHRIILAAINTIFEGKFEEGVRGFTDLLDRYPNYLRLVEPLGVVATFYPGKASQLQHLENSVISRHTQKLENRLDWNTIYRLRYHRSYANMFFEAPSLAIEEFTALIEEGPERPDWLIPFSLINLGRLYANLGRMDEAQKILNRLLDNGQMERFHDIASNMVEKQEKTESLLAGSDGSFIRSIYMFETASAEVVLEQYRNNEGATILYDFYCGESSLLAGDIARAFDYYEHVLDRKVPRYSQSYQMLAAARMAEIMGSQGNYNAAEKYLEKSLDYYQGEFLADMLIKGRKRFYQRLSKNELDTTPSLLFVAPPPPKISGTISD